MAFVQKLRIVEYYLGNKKVSSKTPGAVKRSTITKDYYAVITTPDGRRVRERLPGVTSKEAAREMLQEILANLHTIKETQNDTKNLEQLLDEYANHFSHQEITRDYVREERHRIYKTLVLGLGLQTVSDIQLDRVEQYIQNHKAQVKRAKVKAKPASARTKNLIIGSLYRFGKWLKKQKIWRKNLFARLEKVKGPERKVRRFMTVEEMNKLLAATSSRSRNELDLFRAEERALCYKFLYYTLSRYGSVHKLRVDQLQLDGQPPMVLFSHTNVKGRRNIRKVLHPELVKDLRGWIHKTGKKKTDLLFNMPEKITHIFNRDLASAGIPKVLADGSSLDLHSIKTTGITFMANSGVPIRIIQEMAEHKSPVTTLKHYARVNPQALAQALENYPVLGQEPPPSPPSA